MATTSTTQAKPLDSVRTSVNQLGKCHPVMTEECYPATINYTCVVACNESDANRRFIVFVGTNNLVAKRVKRAKGNPSVILLLLPLGGLLLCTTQQPMFVLSCLLFWPFLRRPIQLMLGVLSCMAAREDLLRAKVCMVRAAVAYGVLVKSRAGII